MDILDRRLRPHPDAMVSRVGEEMVILHRGTETYYELDATGTLIWEELERDTLPRGICEQIAREYMVKLVQVENDTRAFLEELLEQALIA